VLLDKKARRKVEYVPDFVGFEVRTVRQACEAWLREEHL
jgi:hypothetical protein